jgi:hypothetical protein
MSASRLSLISRTTRALLCFVGVLQPAVATTTDVDNAVSSIKFSEATTSLLNWTSVGNLITALDAQWPCTVVLANVLRSPDVSETHIASSDHTSTQHSGRVHPIAKQLAVTRRLNVAKGRKPAQKKINRTTRSHRTTASTMKAKPVVQSRSKKRAPKRRHVWLSNQARIVRQVVNNVTTFQRPSRSNARSVILRNTHRLARLAA